MLETIVCRTPATVPLGKARTKTADRRIWNEYRAIVQDGCLAASSGYRLDARLGSGGQGVVFLARHQGSDGFSSRCALKVLSPTRYPSSRAYQQAVARMAEAASRVGELQHEALVEVRKIFRVGRIRVLEMPWVDGFDLGQLLHAEMLDRAYTRVSLRRWHALNERVVTAGDQRPRLRPASIAAIATDGLEAMASLHEAGLVHGDLKPANIMLNRYGRVRIVDLSTVTSADDPTPTQQMTPLYAAPDVVETRRTTAAGDLCSLGYVLVELALGRPLFAGIEGDVALQQFKRNLPHKLPEMFESVGASDPSLVELCQGLVLADTALRLTATQALGISLPRLTRVTNGAATPGSSPANLRHWLEEL